MVVTSALFGMLQGKIYGESPVLQNLLNDLKTLLSQDDRMMADGQLLKNKVIELGLALDADLLKLLLSHAAISKHFFTDVVGVKVFDKIKFQQFVSNKTFLPDSYTAFKNKIGLMTDTTYLTDSKEVVLAWPYKDCVLEGGQTKEEAKRSEIFYNETLAPDQIDRLLAPKALTNFKRYDKTGAHKVASISKDDNLIIKGNNLLALHTLKRTYAGQVKLIYIDPPYNTGNDEFRYNDTFNHSTWLTFTKNRLEIAKSLLSQDGAIFVSIDNNELGYMLILLDAIFGKDNLQSIITIKRGSVTGHKTINPGVVNVAEYVVVYAKNKSLWKPNKAYAQRERNDRYNNFIINRGKSTTDWSFCSLLEAFAAHVGVEKSKLKKHFGDDFEKQIFSFIVANADAVIQFAYPDEDKVSEEARQLILASKAEPEKVFYLSRKDEPDIYLLNGQRILFYSDRLIEVEGKKVTGELISDIWLDVLPNDLHNEGGVKLKKGKKPEKLLQRIYEIGCNKKDDLVLDFYIGSGTSAAVAHKCGLRYIGIEQLDYIESKAVTRLNNVIKGDSTGISKSVGWQGGGSFTYCELADANQHFVSAIEMAKDATTLGKIWQAMQDKAFLSYRVNPASINAAAADFAALSVEEQKRFLMEVLDKNMLYVPLSEIEDESYGISADDKKLNAQLLGQS